MKRKISDLTDSERIETLDALYTAASAIKGRDAVKKFLKELLTTSERVMLGRRILIAQALIAGSTHVDIMDSMKVGPDTIQRVERWLETSFSSYQTAVAEMERIQTKRRKPKYPRDGSFEQFTQKFRLHFLFRKPSD